MQGVVRGAALPLETKNPRRFPGRGFSIYLKLSFWK
jgi:hypothetical protein